MEMSPMMEEGRQLLRHTVATLAYRGGKALRGAPESFASYRPAPDSRTPAEILAHLCDLLDWVLSQARGAQKWQPVPPVAWDTQVGRFFAGLAALDDYLASTEPLAYPAAQLFQGGIADAFTHVGQLTMLRRLAGAPIRGENYFVADIAVGRVGPSQSPARREFD